MPSTIEATNKKKMSAIHTRRPANAHHERRFHSGPDDRSGWRKVPAGAADRPGRARVGGHSQCHQDHRERQAGRLAGDAGGSRGRRDHCRRPEAAGAAYSGRLRGARRSGDRSLCRELLHRRSARRHARIHRRTQRLYGQHRTGHRRPAAARRDRRTRARTAVARPRRLRRRANEPVGGCGHAPRKPDFNSNTVVA